MKKNLLFSIFWVLSICVAASPLEPNCSAPLFEHLVEVNKEWINYYSPEDFMNPVYFKNDQERIQMHLLMVEKHLRKNITKGLSQQQKKERNTALDILQLYYQNSCFPQNYYHQSRQPYFIDNHGTACAVGQLVIETGFSDIAHQISAESNYAYIRELAPSYPMLSRWAKSFGFTLEELAWIQPGYPPASQTWNEVGNGSGANGPVNIMKAFGDETLYLAGEFTEVDGVEANNIIAWNGANWSALGNGVNGVINDIEINADGVVYIGGDFYVNGHPEMVNLAYWENGSWHGYETSNMDGVIYALHLSNRLYVGGDFEIEDDNMNIIRNLAHVKYNEHYLVNHDGAFSVNGPVYNFDHFNNNLLVGGDFSETAFYSNDTSVIHLNTQNLAFWNTTPNNYWQQSFDDSLSPVNALKIIDEKIYFGTNTPTVGLINSAYYQTGIWNPISSLIKIDSSQSSFINGVLQFNDFVILYGNFQYVPLLGTYSQGIYVANPSSGSMYGEGAEFDAPVTAAESFQNQIYFAGEFTSVQNQNFSGLVSTPFDATTLITDIENNKNLKVYSSIPSQINIQYADFEEPFNLSIYSLNGQLQSQNTLTQGSGEFSVSTQNWVSGVYVYQAISKSGEVYSGKVYVY